MVRKTSPDDPWEPLSERELAAVHDVEVGREWLCRAHGHLLAFHHAVGHGMDHFADAESALRAAGHAGLADTLRDDVLPRGVVDDRWSYAVVESFETTMLDAVSAYEADVRAKLVDGERHVAERRQEHRWRHRTEEQ